MPSKACIRVASIAALAVLTTGATARADKQTLLLEVAKAAPQVRYFGDEVSVTSRWDDVSRGDEKIAECLAAIDAARRGGVQLEEEFELAVGYGGGQLPHTRSERGQRGGQVHYSNLALLHRYCADKRAKVQLVRAYLAVRGAKQALDRVERVTNMARYQQAAMEQRVCAREVGRALSMGNAPGLAFARPAVSLGQAGGAVCGALASALERVRDALAKQADASGFHAVLDGDRRRVFDQNLLHVAEVYGEGGFPLEAPEHFESLDVWYVPAPDRGSYGASAWRVTIYRFEAARLAGTETRGGEGSRPPRSAYAPLETAPSPERERPPHAAPSPDSAPSRETGSPLE